MERDDVRQRAVNFLCSITGQSQSDVLTNFAPELASLMDKIGGPEPSPAPPADQSV